MAGAELVAFEARPEVCDPSESSSLRSLSLRRSRDSAVDLDLL